MFSREVKRINERSWLEGSEKTLQDQLKFWSIVYESMTHTRSDYRDLTRVLGPQNVAEEWKWDPLFQENLSWWNIIVWASQKSDVGTLQIIFVSFLVSTWKVIFLGSFFFSKRPLRFQLPWHGNSPDVSRTSILVAIASALKNGDFVENVDVWIL